jgi:hypothetical protein
VFESFAARLQYVGERFVREGQKFRREASWSDEEIAQLDHTLRTFVANRQLAMRDADSRVTWAGSPEFLEAISGLKRVKYLDPSSPAYVEWLAEYFSGYA